MRRRAVLSQSGLGGPVVNVPVVLVKEEVVFAHLGEGHVGEVRGGEGGQKEVRFESAAFAGLVYFSKLSVWNCFLSVCLLR